MDEESLQKYLHFRAARPLDRKQEWTVGVLRRSPLNIPPPKPDVWGPITSSCVSTVVLSGGAGYLLGLGFGFIFSAMEQNQMDTTLKVTSQFRQAYKGTWTRMKTQGRTFGAFGALFLSFECPLEKYRAKHDLWNAMIAGTFTGSVLGLMAQAGVRGTLFSGFSTGLFCLVIDYFMGR